MGKRKYGYHLRPLDNRECQDFFGFMDGYCSMLGDLPDGAWAEACKEGVVCFNQQYKTHYDPHEAWLLWCEHSSSAAEVSVSKEK